MMPKNQWVVQVTLELVADAMPAALVKRIARAIFRTIYILQSKDLPLLARSYKEWCASINEDLSNRDPFDSSKYVMLNQNPAQLPDPRATAASKRFVVMCADTASPRRPWRFTIPP